jgi:hypothetical protein
MLGYIAAALFIIAFLINAISTSTPRRLRPAEPADARPGVPRPALGRSRHGLVVRRPRTPSLTAARHQSANPPTIIAFAGRQP